MKFSSPFSLALIAAGAAILPVQAQEPAEATLTVDQFVEVNLKMLAGMDIDKDGIVTKAEVATVLSQGTVTAASQAEADAIFDAIDANRDGKVVPAEVDPYERASFKAQDTNGDGLLTPEERRAAAAKAAKPEK